MVPKPGRLALDVMVGIRNRLGTGPQPASSRRANGAPSSGHPMRAHRGQARVQPPAPSAPRPHRQHRLRASRRTAGPRPTAGRPAADRAGWRGTAMAVAAGSWRRRQSSNPRPRAQPHLVGARDALPIGRRDQRRAVSGSCAASSACSPAAPRVMRARAGFLARRGVNRRNVRQSVAQSGEIEAGAAAEDRQQPLRMGLRHFRERALPPPGDMAGLGSRRARHRAHGGTCASSAGLGRAVRMRKSR